MAHRPLMLMILDGWGWREESEANAVRLANTPNFTQLWQNYPHTFLRACGEDVGLPAGTMGNSEVGHLNLGAGRIVYQDLTRIQRSISDKSFFQNQTLVETFAKVQQSSGRLHLVGLASSAGVHSHLDHLFALLEAAQKFGISKIYLHLFSDGRDTPPSSGKAYVEQIETKCRELGNASIATISGRFFAMDRDKRWERTQKAWAALVLGEGEQAKTASEVFDKSYALGVTDEFIPPTVLNANGLIQEQDSVIFFNYRSDRARQITRALAFPDFKEFPRAKAPKLAQFVCMTEYDESFQLPVLFPVANLQNIFGHVVSQAGLKQLRAAETEKYAHVTFFFNGGAEQPFPNEERVLIPSVRDVPTYDLKPEMSAAELAQAVLAEIAKKKFDVFILNFANPDMVGHTGSLSAAIKAVETVDTYLGEIVRAILAQGGELLITADHGNCEQMKDENGNPHTSHTLNPVPCLFVSARASQARFNCEGRLADVAPTLLYLLNLTQPNDMTGKNLLDIHG